MLISLVFDPIFAFLAYLFNLLPDFAVSGFSTSIGVLFDLISTVGYFIPLGTLASVLSVFLAFYALQFAFSAFNWLLRKIPTIS